ncbi:MAG: 2-C-methyl-D-erythritol 2,4-cyclodiphosphate synthase [Clostridia bacterium]|nr:2-C-methyl-D-erythritol 2,4-cyclodiphosphate synthase [Clostridia bacterium]
MRVGIGYDVHQLVKGEQLILGGVHIPYEKGLKGHSDGDVLLHALMDCLLGAAGEGDIGQKFPDRDPRFKDVSSLLLLREVYELIRQKGYRINNIDMVIIAQKPYINKYKQEILHNICGILDIDKQNINLKATTTENLGFEGRGEGIAAWAVCTVDV